MDTTDELRAETRMTPSDFLTGEINIGVDLMAGDMEKFSDWVHEQTVGKTRAHTRLDYVPTDDVARLRLMEALDVSQLLSLALYHCQFANEAMGRVGDAWEEYCRQCVEMKLGITFRVQYDA